MGQNSAYVYVLTNPAMPGLVKIGMTTKSVKERIKELSSTGVPEPFQLYYACELGDGLDPAEVERDMHELFASYRHNKRREFFAVDPKRVKLALKYVGRPVEAKQPVKPQPTADDRTPDDLEREARRAVFRAQWAANGGSKRLEREWLDHRDALIAAARTRRAAAGVAHPTPIADASMTAPTAYEVWS